jgi:ABC-type bacteriocin/lantibiotic exporter with double-glycine peptidase domain
VTPSAKQEARWFLGLLRPSLRSHVISIALAVLGSSMFLLDPLLIKWLIDRVLPRKDLQLLLTAAAGFFGIYAGRVALTTLGRLISFRAVQDLAVRMRLHILKHLNELSADYHDTAAPGDILYTLEQDVDQVSEIGSGLVPSVLQAVFNAFFVTIAVCILNWRLALVLVPLVPLFFLFKKYFGSRLRHASDSAQGSASQETEFLQEHLSSIIQIQLLHQEDAQTERFLRRAIAKRDAVNHRTATEMLFAACYMGLIALGTVGIVCYGGYQVFVGGLTIGGLVVFYSYLGRLFDPVSAAVDIYSKLNRLRSSIRRVLEIAEQHVAVTNQPSCVPIPSSTKSSIQIENMSFSYCSDCPYALENINVRINAGEKIALIGASGSGKSTITKLIARLYDVSRGKVCIDGLDVRTVDVVSLRTRICYLMQDTVLFDRSLKENLLLANPDATDEQLIQAIQMAELETLLGRLPEGWDAPLGPRGNVLSGGERQRIALARAALQAPSLLILDESTSALDGPTEQRVFAKLRRHFKHQTMILISHRVSSLSWSDRIIVIDCGRIVEEGTHEYLMQREGAYRNLYNLSQTSDTALTSKPSASPELLPFKPVIATE